mmetsp:Transcript_27964/g.39038  ORF Transcript_27964/g.39038 Transcript_27964/m.39038 type:complete len:342 (-) Transcript_27964:237-1262(-)
MDTPDQPSNAALQKFLSAFKVADIIKDKNELFTISSTSTVEETLKLLGKKKILSMPVIDEKKKEFVGIVSISDIVIAICFNPCFAKLAKGGTIDDLSREDMEKIISRSVLKNAVVDIVGVTEEGKNLWTFDENDNLLKLAEYFSQGVHRALIIRESGGPCLLSQTDYARFLCNEVKKTEDKNVEDRLKISLEKLGYAGNKGTISIISVQDEETALGGFRRLLQWHSFRDWNLAAMPVVDSKSGKIIGNLSESDLRGINENRLLDLLFVVPMYLKTYHGQMKKPLTISPETSFGDALDKLVESKVHRLWIVDKNEKPIGVFSLSDVISQFTTFAFAHEIPSR